MPVIGEEKLNQGMQAKAAEVSGLKAVRILHRAQRPGSAGCPAMRKYRLDKHQ